MTPYKQQLAFVKEAAIQILERQGFPYKLASLMVEDRILKIAGITSIIEDPLKVALDEKKKKRAAVFEKLKELFHVKSNAVGVGEALTGN